MLVCAQWVSVYNNHVCLFVSMTISMNFFHSFYGEGGKAGLPACFHAPSMGWRQKGGRSRIDKICVPLSNNHFCFQELSSNVSRKFAGYR